MFLPFPGMDVNYITLLDRYIQPILDVLNVKKSKSKQKVHPTTTNIKPPFPQATSKRNYPKAFIIPSKRNRHEEQQQKTNDHHQQQHYHDKMSNNNNSDAKIIQTNKNTKKKQELIDPKDGSLILLVDFKADPNKSAKILNQVIKPLKPYLSKVKDGIFYKGSVTVLISGNRPREDSLYDYENDINHDKTRTITTNPIQRLTNIFKRKENITNNNKEGKERFLFIDGRINDVHRQEPTSLMPLISLNWSTVQLYRLLGKGDEFMKKCADLAHSQGKKLRIWGAPNTESVWKRMMRNNIDWLSIDDHERFARFASKAN